MGKNKKPKDNVDDTLEIRRELKKMGKEPVPEPSDKLKNAKPWEKDSDD